MFDAIVSRIRAALGSLRTEPAPEPPSIYVMLQLVKELAARVGARPGATPTASAPDVTPICRALTRELSVLPGLHADPCVIPDAYDRILAAVCVQVHDMRRVDWPAIQTRVEAVAAQCPMPVTIGLWRPGPGKVRPATRGQWAVVATSTATVPACSPP